MGGQARVPEGGNPLRKHVRHVRVLFHVCCLGRGGGSAEASTPATPLTVLLPLCPAAAICFWVGPRAPRRAHRQREGTDPGQGGIALDQQLEEDRTESDYNIQKEPS